MSVIVVFIYFVYILIFLYNYIRMATKYTRKGSVVVAGVKKAVYCKEGSTKKYVVYKKRHMALTRYRKIKSTTKKVRKSRGGEDELVDIEYFTNKQSLTHNEILLIKSHITLYQNDESNKEYVTKLRDLLISNNINYDDSRFSYFN